MLDRPINHPIQSVMRERAFWRVFDGFGFYIVYVLSARGGPLSFFSTIGARLDPPPGWGGAETKRERKDGRRRNCGENASSRVTRDAIFSSFGGEIKCSKKDASTITRRRSFFFRVRALFLSFSLFLSLSLSLSVSLSLRVCLCVCFLR